MKNRVVNVIIILLFAAGIAVIFYPAVTSYLSKQKSNDVISTFEQVADEYIESEQPDDNVQTEQSQQLYADMQAYNRVIYEDGQSNLKDPFVFETPAFDLTSYGFENNVAGYVSIPRMEVELPIYFGATKENMALGAVSLGYTSTPIGGENTNIVLAAHRGYRGTAMFRNIEAMQIGDKVYITNLWETLTYKVVEAKVILPTDIDEIRIQDGRDMLTLITCHPYTKNYQRYVVYCERTADEEEQTAEADTGLELSYILKLDKLSESQRLIFAEKWVPIGIAVILLLAAVCKKILTRWRKRRERRS